MSKESRAVSLPFQVGVGRVASGLGKLLGVGGMLLTPRGPTSMTWAGRSCRHPYIKVSWWPGGWRISWETLEGFWVVLLGVTFKLLEILLYSVRFVHFI